MFPDYKEQTMIFQIGDIVKYKKSFAEKLNCNYTQIGFIKDEYTYLRNGKSPDVFLIKWQDRSLIRTHRSNIEKG